MTPAAGPDAFDALIAGFDRPRPAAAFEGLALERRSIAEQVANRILALVKSGNLKTGDKLPTEQQMAVALGISRPALREALKALTVLGVLESRQGGRYTVTDLSPGRLIAPLQFLMFVQDYDVAVHFEARETVDLDLVRLAAERGSDDELAQIVRLAAEGHAFLNDAVGFRVLDFAFHQTINTAARNPLLATMAAGLYDIALDIRRIATETPGVIAKSLDDHDRIAEALHRRDATAAVEAYRDHLRHTRETTERALAARRPGSPPAG
ncbi:MAG: FadR family transcriptional regulator [Bauldia sp.]|nr:FadR family transcriptional regulator [Bauldia sp.]